MLDIEFKYFIDNQEDLVRKYKGKVLVIIGEEIIAAYDSLGEAYDESVKKYKLGTFMIQRCEPGEECYTSVFHSKTFA